MKYREELDVDAQSEAGSNKRPRRTSRRPMSASRERSETPSDLDDVTSVAEASEEDDDAPEPPMLKKGSLRAVKRGRGGHAMQALHEEIEEEEADEDVESMLDD